MSSSQGCQSCQNGLLTLIAGTKSITQKTVANVFTQGKYVAVYPMLTKADAGNSLVDFTDEVGIPQVLMTDLASELSGQHTDFVDLITKKRVLTIKIIPLSVKLDSYLRDGDVEWRRKVFQGDFGILV